MKFIYSVTSIASKEIAYISRCWAWYPTSTQAYGAVRRNDGDMHELSYDYLVIEKTPPGMMQFSEQIQWYHWVKNDWKPCKVPVFAKRIANWGIG